MQSPQVTKNTVLCVTPCSISEQKISTYIIKTKKKEKSIT